jgi:MFS family permease
LAQASNPSTFAPLSQRTFAVLWLATVASNIGGWMTDTASAWLMTSLAPSPVMVSLVQAATMGPMFLLALPAGALADLVDRRRLMIGLQIGLGLSSLALGLITASGAMTPSWLLLLTFLAGVGSALLAPTWQSIVPELIPHELLRPAVALNGLAVNIARAIGPVIGGVLIVSVSIAAPYFVDVGTYLLVIGALIWWKRAPVKEAIPENFGGALKAGLRYVRHSSDLHRVFARALAFFVSASCYWALLPLLVRNQMRGGATGYGIVLGAIGAGAIAGAMVLPRLRQRLGANGMVLAGSLATAALSALLALTSTVALAVPILFILGSAWISVLTTLSATAQALLPNWVRGRGLAVYLTVFYGSMTIGGVCWGRVAQSASLPIALFWAAALGALAALLLARLRLREPELSLTPSMHWPEPVIAEGVEPDGGPVMVTIEYTVAIERQPALLDAMQALSHVRRRDGAYDWGVMYDTERPTRIVEWFLVASWDEHLRQHGRVSAADKALEDRVRLLATGVPKVHHLLALSRVRTGKRSVPSDHVE